MLATVQFGVFMFGFHLLSERNYIEKILENACYCSACCIYVWFPSSIGKKLLGYFFFSVALRPNANYGLLILEVF